MRYFLILLLSFVGINTIYASDTDSLGIIDEWDIQVNTLMRQHQWRNAIDVCNRLAAVNCLPVRTRLRVLANRGICLRECGDYPAAVRDLAAAVKMKKDYARLNIDGPLFSLSSTYIYTGDYTEALRCLDAVSLSGRDADYALNRANAMFRRGAQHDLQQAVAIVDSILDVSDTATHVYATAMINRGYMMWSMSRHDEAYRCLATALRHIDTASDQYHYTLGNISLIEAGKGRYVDAVTHIGRVIQWFQSRYGTLHPDYVNSLRKRAEILLMSADTIKACTAFADYFVAERSLAVQQYQMLDEQHRMDYWLMKKPLVSQVFQLRDHSPELLMDVALFRRQMTLMRSNCQTVSQSVAVDNKALRRALRSGEAAVEFICYYDEGMRDTVYAALVATAAKVRFAWIGSQTGLHGYRLSPTCTLRDAVLSRRAADKQLLFSDSLLGEKIWCPVMQMLPPDIKDVYFAPDGLMHILAVEYLPCRVTHGVNLRRLSSTVNLTRRDHATKHNQQRTLLVGALDFDLVCAMPDTVVHDHSATDYLRRNMPRNVWRFKPLKATHVELMALDSIIAHADTTTVQTEEQLKLNLAQYDRLHLSTHGYALYVKEPQRPVAMRDSMMADNTLLASGLALTGANRAHAHANIDDGVLSARELCELDLSNIRFISLSACQTALGTPCDEGPAGLLRALKKAGAATAMASLWEVDDQATCLLMRQFYDHLSQGNTYRQSLCRAQQDVRSYTKTVSSFDPMTGFNSQRQVQPYSSPYYWAAFILVDDMD